jgi:CheY-like chemotaxis protein
MLDFHQMEASSKAVKPILIVDDDPDIREALQFNLETEGYEVYSAQNGQEGLSILEAISRPCLVLLDLVMPVMNGLEFLTSLQKDQSLSLIPVVIVSAYPEKEKEIEEKSIQTKGFLRKPVDLEILLGWTKRFCG